MKLGFKSSKGFFFLGKRFSCLLYSKLQSNILVHLAFSDHPMVLRCDSREKDNDKREEGFLFGLIKCASLAFSQNRNRIVAAAQKGCQLRHIFSLSICPADRRNGRGKETTTMTEHKKRMKKRRREETKALLEPWGFMRAAKAYWPVTLPLSTSSDS